LKRSQGAQRGGSSLCQPTCKKLVWGRVPRPLFKENQDRPEFVLRGDLLLWALGCASGCTDRWMVLIAGFPTHHLRAPELQYSRQRVCTTVLFAPRPPPRWHPNLFLATPTQYRGNYPSRGTRPGRAKSLRVAGPPKPSEPQRHYRDLRFGRSRKDGTRSFLNA